MRKGAAICRNRPPSPSKPTVNVDDVNPGHQGASLGRNHADRQSRDQMDPVERVNVRETARGQDTVVEHPRRAALGLFGGLKEKDDGSVDLRGLVLGNDGPGKRQEHWIDGENGVRTWFQDRPCYKSTHSSRAHRARRRA